MNVKPNSIMERPELEQKTFCVVQKEFILHGREYKVGEIISFKEANELTNTLSNLNMITPQPKETK